MKSLSIVDGGSRSNTPTLLIQEIESFTANYQEWNNNKPLYFLLNCELSWIFVPETLDRKMFYLACPKCKKKVVDDGRGYRCESCNKIHEEAVATYNFSLKVQDCSGNFAIQCLGDVGENIIGMKCSEFYNLSEDLELVKALVQDLLQARQKMLIVLQAKIDSNPNAQSQEENGGPRIRYTAVRAQPYSFSDDNQNLLKKLQLYKAM